MSGPHRLPVEPLSERRWQDIRRNVLARAALEAEHPSAPPEPRRRPFGAVSLGAVTAVAMAAAALLWWSSAGEPLAPSTARVVTDAEPTVASAGDATLELAPHTSVLVVRVADDEWLVSLEHGSVRCAVPTRGERPPFAVEAGRTRVVVVGTAFTVTRDAGADTASVEVDHGAVRVTDPSGERLLHDGERWPESTVAAAEAEHVGAIEARPEAPPTDTSAASDAPSERPHARTHDDEEAAPRLAVGIAPAASVVVAAPSTPTASMASAPSQRERYHAAEALEATDPAAAVSTYDALVREGGPYGAPALVAACRVELEQHHEARARTLCERYLAEHADGINAEDARALLGRMR